jgi:hypothetical protein
VSTDHTKFVTLSAGVTQQATVYRARARRVAVCNFDGGGEVGFRDGTHTLSAVRQDGNDAIPKIMGQEVIIDGTMTAGGQITVSLISDATTVVLVRAIS